MTTVRTEGIRLRFDQGPDVRSTHDDVVRAATPLAGSDGVLTLDEVRAGTPRQQSDVFRALSSDFLDRLHAWHAQPFLKKLVGLVHDPDRAAFMRLAEVANEVGRLPDVSQRIHPGKHSVSVGSHDWNRFPNPRDE